MHIYIIYIYISKTIQNKLNKEAASIHKIYSVYAKSFIGHLYKYKQKIIRARSAFVSNLNLQSCITLYLTKKIIKFSSSKICLLQNSALKSNKQQIKVHSRLMVTFHCTHLEIRHVRI